MPLRRADAGSPLEPAALAAGRRAIGWWLLGSARELTREAGRRLITDGAAQRLVEL